MTSQKRKRENNKNVHKKITTTLTVDIERDVKWARDYR